MRAEGVHSESCVPHTRGGPGSALERRPLQQLAWGPAKLTRGENGWGGGGVVPLPGDGRRRGQGAFRCSSCSCYCGSSSRGGGRRRHPRSRAVLPAKRRGAHTTGGLWGATDSRASCGSGAKPSQAACTRSRGTAGGGGGADNAKRWLPRHARRRTMRSGRCLTCHGNHNRGRRRGGRSGAGHGGPSHDALHPHGDLGRAEQRRPQRCRNLWNHTHGAHGRRTEEKKLQRAERAMLHHAPGPSQHMSCCNKQQAPASAGGPPYLTARQAPPLQPLRWQRWQASRRRAWALRCCPAPAQHPRCGPWQTERRCCRSTRGWRAWGYSLRAPPTPPIRKHGRHTHGHGKQNTRSRAHRAHHAPSHAHGAQTCTRKLVRHSHPRAVSQASAKALLPHPQPRFKRGAPRAVGRARTAGDAAAAAVALAPTGGADALRASMGVGGAAAPGRCPDSLAAHLSASALGSNVPEVDTTARSPLPSSSACTGPCQRVCARAHTHHA
jgi:hypothetical protein